VPLSQGEFDARGARKGGKAGRGLWEWQGRADMLASVSVSVSVFRSPQTTGHIDHRLAAIYSQISPASMCCNYADKMSTRIVCIRRHSALDVETRIEDVDVDGLPSG